jgi:UDP-N-acetylmuramoylalanine-D-glutamate ligase
LKPDLNQAVFSAKENSIIGDIILFTPAFASFGMFQNEYDRGESIIKP